MIRRMFARILAIATPPDVQLARKVAGIDRRLDILCRKVRALERQRTGDYKRLAGKLAELERWLSL